MAAQDFNINIRTIADTTGIKLTQAHLDALHKAAAAGNKEAISALKKLSDAQREAQKAAQAAQQEFQSGIRNAAAYGSIIGGFVAKVIGNLASDTNKVTAELDKQGEHLIDLAQKWTDMAKAATGSEDIAKIAASGVKEIDTLGKAIQKAANPDFTVGETMIDSLVKAFKNTKDAMGPNEELAQRLFEGLQLDQQAAIELNARAIELGRTFQKSFEKRQAESLADALADVADEMAKAKNEQDALTGAMLKTKAGIDRYNELAVVLSNLARQTDLLTAADARRQRQAEAAAKAVEKEVSARREFEVSAFEAEAKEAEAKGDTTGVERARQIAEGLKRGIPLDELRREEIRTTPAGIGESEALVAERERNKQAFLEQQIPKTKWDIDPTTGGMKEVPLSIKETNEILRQLLDQWR